MRRFYAAPSSGCCRRRTSYHRLGGRQAGAAVQGPFRPRRLIDYLIAFLDHVGEETGQRPALAGGVPAVGPGLRGDRDHGPMGTDTTAALTQFRPPSDAGLIPELFDPASGFLRDLGDGLRT